MGPVAIVIPVYGHFRYAARAVHSALTWTAEDVSVILVDDHSPDWDEAASRELWSVVRQVPDWRERIHWCRLGVNRGLTFAWNAGLSLARALGGRWEPEFVCVTNSDVVFSPRWHQPLEWALTSGGYSLVGPVTNAPGSERAQDVTRWLPDYVVRDRDEDIQKTAQRLASLYGHQVIPGTINGFCLMASLACWWRHAWSEDAVFRPRNDVNSRGQQNPTPLMTLQEYELQGRWRQHGLRIGFCPGSFVFHYRSVSRGLRHHPEGACRMSP